MKNVRGMLKGKDKYETFENYLILFIFVGTVLLSIGIGLSAISAKGVPVLFAVSGAFLAFISIVFLIALWLIKELR